jgi:hypothetical protein
MRPHVMFLATVLTTALLAGCINADDGPDQATGEEAPDAQTELRPIEWPELDDAVLRPGVQINTEGRGWCTTNFVFTDAENNIYLGTAGHCVGDSVGANVTLQQDPDFHTGEVGPVIGQVWYSAWAYENVTTESCFVVLSCGAGDGNGDNDFALIKINEEYRNLTHPAVLTYGGPTELAPLDDLEEGQKVLTHGNSPLRPGPTPLDAREGYITQVNDPWTVTACIITSGVPGDSGSNALLGDGRALGIVVTLGAAAPCGTVNGITILETALEYAREKGYEVELATWELIDGGLLP